MARPALLEVLSAAEVGAVHEAALAVLAETGVFVDSPRALECLAAKGAIVDTAPQSGCKGAGAPGAALGRVRFPPSVVEKALGVCPSSFLLYDRDGGEAFRIGPARGGGRPGGGRVVGGDLDGDDGRDPGAVRFATSSCAIRHQEGDSARASRGEDLVLLTRVADALPEIDLVSTQVVAGEAPKEVADSYRLYLVLANSPKPVVTGAFSERGLLDMKALLDAVADGRIEERPPALFDVCPSPPLKWTAIAAANVMDAAAAGLPIEFVSMPMPGAATPVTLAGSIVTHAAETLSGIVLAQAVRPGTRVVWGGAPVGFDMRHGTTPLSAVEATMIAVAYAQMGRHYRLPTHTYAGLSDSKLLDAQAGLETALSGTVAALAGINVIAGAGALDFVGTQMAEKLVLDAEVCGLIRRLLRGIEVTPETLAQDLVIRLGPGADYLGQAHTRRWFRAELRLPDAVIDRLDRRAWEAAGRKDAPARARERVAAILKTAPRGLDPERAAKLDGAMELIMRRAGCPWPLRPCPAGRAESRGGRVSRPEVE